MYEIHRDPKIRELEKRIEELNRENDSLCDELSTNTSLFLKRERDLRRELNTAMTLVCILIEKFTANNRVSVGMAQLYNSSEDVYYLKRWDDPLQDSVNFQVRRMCDD